MSADTTSPFHPGLARQNRSRRSPGAAKPFQPINHPPSPSPSRSTLHSNRFSQSPLLREGFTSNQTTASPRATAADPNHYPFLELPRQISFRCDATVHRARSTITSGSHPPWSPTGGISIEKRYQISDTTSPTLRTSSFYFLVRFCTFRESTRWIAHHTSNNLLTTSHAIKQTNLQEIWSPSRPSGVP